MTLAFWCVLIGLLMPILWTSFAKFLGPKKMPVKNNRNPREYLAGLDGMQKRADWAQQNSFEAFPAFAAAVIIAHITGGAALATINVLAVVWVLARLAYGYCYLTDRSSLRSLCYFVAMLCVIGLFIAAV